MKRSDSLSASLLLSLQDGNWVCLELFYLCESVSVCYRYVDSGGVAVLNIYYTSIFAKA